jgi:integrase
VVSRQGAIELNPTAALKLPTKEVARDRVLNDRELVACWKAAEAEGFPFDKFTHMLILTGQRRGEVAGMRWSEIDFERAMWTIPAQRTKNGTQHTVPLAPLAIEILQSVPRFMNSDLVFTTSGKTLISGFGRHKARLDVEVGASDWRFHDIRRTVATNMAMMRVPPHIIEAILNHKTGIISGVAAIYNRHAYLDEKHEALEQWAEQMRAMVAQASLRRKRIRGPGIIIRQWFRSIPVYRYRKDQLEPVLFKWNRLSAVNLCPGQEGEATRCEHR